MPLVDGALRSFLSQADVEGDFAVEDAGLSGARLSRVRLGDAGTPDAAAQSADVRLGWGLLGPRVETIRLNSPRLRARIDQRGISFGALDALRPEPGGKPMQSLPDLALEVVDGQAVLSTPAGDVPVTFASRGRLTRDFSGAMTVAPVSQRSGDSELADARLSLVASTTGGVLNARLEGAATTIRLPGIAIQSLTIAGTASVPRRLSEARIGVTARGGAATVGDATLEAIVATLSGAPTTQDRWRVQASASAGAASSGAWKATAPEVSLSAVADATKATGEWRIHAAEVGDGARRAIEPTASGDLVLDAAREGGARLEAHGQIALQDIRFNAKGRAEALAVIPALNGSPFGPIIGSGRSAIDRVLEQFSVSTAIRLDWRDTEGRISVAGPLSVDAAKGGGRLTLAPLAKDAPVLQILLPTGAVEARASAALSGGGLPPLRATLSNFSMGPKGLAADGDVSLRDWRAAGGRIDLAQTRFKLSGAGNTGTLTLDGSVTLSGAADAVSVTDLRAPLQIDVRWGEEQKVTLRNGCAPLSLGGLGIPAHRFGTRDFALCGLDGGVLYGVDRTGRRHGGFAIDAITLPGATDDRARRAVQLTAERVEGRLDGGATDTRIEISARAPAYTIDFDATRRIRFTSDLITARTAPDGRITGLIAGGDLDDPALPTTLTNVRSRWSAGSENGRTVVRFSEGAAHVTDKPVMPAPGAPDWIARFNPLDVEKFTATLIDGKLDAEGSIVLESGARPLAAFTAKHDLATGVGRADVKNSELMFSRKLDLFEITELARGVVDHVEGPVGVDLAVTWDAAGILSQGRISPRNVSLNAQSLGPVTGLSGDIVFDDLFALTTPPGQRLTIAELNPGVIVRDGVISFQMLAPDRIRVEGAQWPFAAGKLSVDPQTVVIGADTFRMTLSLREVDVQKLLDQLEFRDLTATGEVEGQFPLVFDPNGGRIERGELHGDGKGGTISYTGAAGDALTGPGQIAFDALKSFAYDNLVLELEGDLDGDIVTAIRFSGENMQPVGGLVPSGALPIPGVSRIKVAGWPFKFTVSVRAPFRRLVKTSDDIQDARSLVEEAIQKPEIDVEAPPPK